MNNLCKIGGFYCCHINDKQSECKHYRKKINTKYKCKYYLVDTNECLNTAAQYYVCKEYIEHLKARRKKQWKVKAKAITKD